MKIMVFLLVSLFAACTVATSDDVMMKDDAVTNDMNEFMDDSMSDEMKDSMDDNMMYRGNVLAGTKSQYLEFNEEDYDTAITEGKTVLLNFYASWCPVCKEEEPEVLMAFNELAEENVVGFRVNYKDSDTDSVEEALAREFGISYQHTKVIIKDGERVLKSPESWNKERYLEEINKVI